MKPQELAPDAIPRRSSCIRNELWYSRLITTKADSKGGRRHKKAKPPQGGGLNGGAQEPRSANFSISCFVDPVLPPPCPFEQEKNAFVRTGEVHLGLGQKNDPDPALGANPTKPAACFCRQMKGETDH